jgi:hypothetical protein
LSSFLGHITGIGPSYHQHYSQTVMWQQSHIAEMLAELSTLESNLRFLVVHVLINQQTLHSAADHKTLRVCGVAGLIGFLLATAIDQLGANRAVTQCRPLKLMFPGCRHP